MPIIQSYYLNGADLASSTAIFLDPYMTVCAPDGYYSDGLIVRLQTGCVLQETEPLQCDCGGLSCNEFESIAGGAGLYILNVDLGTDTGAVIVTFMPNGTPDGIKVNYNGSTYNQLSSVIDGYHAAPPNLPTYVGDTTFDCGLVANSPYVLTEYENSGTVFNPTGNFSTVTITSAQVSLTLTLDPMQCIMVIPKTSPAPSGLSAIMYGICEGSSYNISISCPQKLKPFYSTGEGGNTGESCGLPTDQIYYSAPVNGDGATLGLYDWIFTDNNGQNVLGNGYYTAPIHCPAPYDSFEIQNGIIKQFLTFCSPVTLDYDILNSATACVSGGISVANLLIEWMPFATPIVNVNANATGSTSIQMGVYKITLKVSYSAPILGCGGIAMRIKLNTVEVATAPYIVPSAGGTYQITHTFSANGLTNYLVEAIVEDGTPL